MRNIKLTGKVGKDKFAIVNDEDFEWINQWKWHLNPQGYVLRNIYLGGGHKNPKYKTIFLHRLIINTPKEFITDHIDHNLLNNQKDNLRIVNHSQNMMNKICYKNNKLETKGVRKRGNRYDARIQVNKKAVYLGSFVFFKQAQLAYDNAEKTYFGEYARRQTL